MCEVVDLELRDVRAVGVDKQSRNAEASANRATCSMLRSREPAVRTGLHQPPCDVGEVGVLVGYPCLQQIECSYVTVSELLSVAGHRSSSGLAVVVVCDG